MKPRRDITLGEMQDECSKRMHICAPDVDGNNECKYFEACKQMRSGVFVKPCPEVWDLTDPPRFNERQMAFWRGIHGMGITAVQCTDDATMINMFDGKDVFAIAKMSISGIPCGIKSGERLDLAELLDSAPKT